MLSGLGARALARLFGRGTPSDADLEVAPAMAAEVPPSAVEGGWRIYAIGDIHGRLDLLQDLLARIEADSAGRPPAKVRIVVLGDVIDRGPDSAAVVEVLRAACTTDRFVVLKGNHEAAMVDALDGDLNALRLWLTYGGNATLRSWGLPAELIDLRAADALLPMAREKIGHETIYWMANLPLTHRSGDFFFVHAGIRPGVALEEQTPKDLMWIRDEFLGSDAAHPAVIVHGHTISETGPELTPWRIGIDTGAYRTERLTAVGLEGEERWWLSTGVG